MTDLVPLSICLLALALSFWVERRATRTKNEIAKMIDGFKGMPGTVWIEQVRRVSMGAPVSLVLRAEAFAMIDGAAEVDRLNGPVLRLEDGSTVDLGAIYPSLFMHEDGDDGDVGEGARVSLIAIVHPRPRA